MAGTIRSLEIFAAGTYTPGNSKVPWTVTEQDLDGMIEAFGALQGTNLVKPHLKLGHSDTQKWFGQDKGVPTLGWIERIYRAGRKLYADIADVPDALLDMIKQRRYHNVSAEIYPPGAIKHDGKEFGHVLSAVALLGTEMPAVNDLAGLASALFAHQFTAPVEAAPQTFAQEEEAGMFTQEQVDSLIAAAVSKAVGEAKGEYQSEVDNLRAELTTTKARAETAEGKLASQAADFAQREAETTVNEAIKQGKLLPRQKDMALAFMSSQGVMKFGGKEKSGAELFKDFLATFGAQVDLSEKGAGKYANGHDKPGEFASAAQEVAHLVEQKRREDPKLDYGAAMAAVFAADPDLKARYAQGE